MNLPGYPVFRRTVLDLTGIDLDQYKGTQMERRLQTIMRRAGAPDLAGYAKLLQGEPSHVKAFKDFLTINVSEFFRNPEKFDELKTLVLPRLLKGGAPIKIWSAGCSNGSEPYSVAILLDELGYRGNQPILATDLDEEILKVAQAGVYQERDIKNVSPERRARYFNRAGDLWEVKPPIRNQVKFLRQNLLSDPFDTGFDLILCRNVVIYFTDEAKDRLYRRFHQSLKPGGVLFVGGTESLLRAKELGFSTLSPFFYQAVK